MRIISKRNLKQFEIYNTIRKKIIKRNIKGKNNLIKSDGVICSNVEFNIQGNNNVIVIHPSVYLNNVSFNLYGDSHQIFIGRNCCFNGRGSIWAEDNNCFISIGQGSTFEGIHLSATEPNSKLIIGEDCMFSYDIDVRTGDSHSIIAKSDGQRINYAKNIIFGNHIWVASHCIFTKGAGVANNSIVGTGSLVNQKFIKENALIVGRPAKVIKDNIEWLRERIYHTDHMKQSSDETTTINSIVGMNIIKKQAS